MSLPHVLGAVATAIQKASTANRVVIWTRGEEDLTAAWDTAAADPDGSGGTAPGTLVRDAASGGRTLRLRPEEVDPEACVLAVPLVFGGRVVGIIDVRGPGEGGIGDSDVGVLETMAAHAAAAIDAARLYTLTEEASLTDPLTGLANRRRLESDLAAECERSRRYGRPLAFVMADVDNFKSFNDHHGHQRGDQILAQLGQLLRDEIRTSDSAYRYGGEEFAILVRETTQDAALQLAERLRVRVTERFATASSLGPVTASFGVAASEQTGADPSALVRCADEALYAAKAAGRDRVVLFAHAEGHVPS